VNIQSERREKALVISLEGSFDALTADAVQRYIGTQLDKGHQLVVLDLSQVSFLSSAGVRVLLAMLKRTRSTGADFLAATPQPGVQRTLEISGLERVLRVYPSVADAVRSFEVRNT
jgi:anti-anti-sigma factor